MATALLCDGCGKDIALEDKITISFAAIETGSIQCDLCMDCSADMRDTPIWAKMVGDARAAREEEEQRRQAIMRQQQEELDARAQVLLQQEKETNAAMRAAGQV